MYLRDVSRFINILGLLRARGAPLDTSNTLTPQNKKKISGACALQIRRGDNTTFPADGTIGTY